MGTPSDTAMFGLWHVPCRLGRAPAGRPTLLRFASTLQQNIAAWEAKASKELKGKDANEALAFTTPDVRERPLIRQCAELDVRLFA